jgi:hypothetical protein
MLWHRSDIPPADLSLQPLSYLAKGNGLSASRSSWTDPNAVHLTVRLEGKHTASHEGYDEGHISLHRGVDRLLVHRNLQAPSITNTTIVFKEASHHAMNPAQTSPAIDREAEGETYYYVRGDITNAWRRQYNADRALLFRRSVLHLRPNHVVVSDVTRSNAVYDPTHTKKWYSQYGSAPTVTGNRILSVVGSSRVYVETLHPTGGTYTTTNPATGYWTTAYAPAEMEERQSWLHVIEATGASSAQVPVELIDGTGGRGALIGGTTVAMFTKDPDGASITSLSYTVDTSGSSTHYIADLIPNASYEVTIDGGAPAQHFASAAGLIVFENPTASPHTYEIVQSGTVTCYRDRDGDRYSDGMMATAAACPTDYYTVAQLIAISGDCNDTNHSIHPGAVEICGDGIDQDCSGADLPCSGGRRGRVRAGKVRTDKTVRVR